MFAVTFVNSRYFLLNIEAHRALTSSLSELTSGFLISTTLPVCRSCASGATLPYLTLSPHLLFPISRQCLTLPLRMD